MVKFGNKGGKMNKLLHFCTALILVSLLVPLGIHEAAAIPWTPEWSMNGYSAFDRVEVFIVNDGGGGPFQSPGLTLSHDEWTETLVNPNYIFAAATIPDPDAGTQTWTFSFAEVSDMTLDILTWSGDTLTDLTGRLDILGNGGGDYYEGTSALLYSDGLAYNRTPTPQPEPATMLLLGSGLIALAGGLRFRRKKK
jgi:hypothetical protein